MVDERGLAEEKVATERGYSTVAPESSTTITSIDNPSPLVFPNTHTYRRSVRINEEVERKEGGKGEGEEEKERKKERTFLHQPRPTSQSESSSEDRVNVRDVHLVVLCIC
jgi:hypothetical protein